MPTSSINVVPPGQRVSRRAFVELLGLAGAAGALGAIGTGAASVLDRPAGAQPAAPAALPPGYTPDWPDGVMAGDPQPTSSVIWTRVTEPGVPDVVPVLWEVAEDAAFSTIVAGGAVDAVSGSDRTAKVAVAGLAPDRWYHYRFTAAGDTSPAGRIRTSPAAGSVSAGMKLVWASCQQRSSTYASHRAIAEEPDLDLWIHLGDYVYVNDSATITKQDYRDTYHTFRSDPLLQQLQARVPTVAVWDDGEFYNGIDASGDPARLANAMSAWVEAFPLMPPPGEPTRIHRELIWGDLAQLLMIDTRQHRDPAIDETDTRTPQGAAIFDPDRTTLGTDQRNWLFGALGGSTQRWKVLGNSYNLGMWRIEDLDDGTRPLPAGLHQNEGNYAPNEAWDDYWAERKALLEHVTDNGIDNFVSLSGHTHIWLASSLSPDPDDATSPTAGFDFTCGSLTADPDVIADAVADGSTPQAAYGFYRQLAEASRAVNPWQAYVNFLNFGYGVATFTPTELVVDFKGIDVRDADAEPELLARFVVPAGDPCATTAEYFDEPLYGYDSPPVAVPHTPWQTPCPAEVAPVGPTNDGSTTAAPGAATGATPRFTG